jgi:hypothetical protein
LIHCAGREAVGSNSIVGTKKPPLLGDKPKYDDFVFATYVPIEQAIKGYYWIPSPVNSDADANDSWYTRNLRNDSMDFSDGPIGFY